MLQQCLDFACLSRACNGLCALQTPTVAPSEAPTKVSGGNKFHLLLLGC